MLHTRSSVSLLASLILCAVSNHAMSAEYYTWIDENGVTNYAERNPSDYNARFVSPEAKFGYTSETPEEDNPADNTATEGDAGEDTSERTPDDVDRHIEDERARIDQEIAVAKKSNCAIGKRNLAQLEAYARIRVKGDDGQEKVLTDAEKADRISAARQTVRENCTS